ncbi:hypothetical protein Vretimale_11182, partial [Volvox reticuliferus]
FNNIHSCYPYTNRSTTVAAAKIKNSEPPTYCSTRSLKYCDSKPPPATARPVATPWPATAPAVTPNGDEAAASAIVARKDLSPHSAANTSVKVDSTSRNASSLPVLSPSTTSLASSFSSAALSSASFASCMQGRAHDNDTLHAATQDY